MQGSAEQKGCGGGGGGGGCAELHQYLVPQKSNLMHNTCTDDYDNNNEYLAVEYIIFFTNDII